jgi:hypothetical protein
VIGHVSSMSTAPGRLRSGPRSSCTEPPPPWEDDKVRSTRRLPGFTGFFGGDGVGVWLGLDLDSESLAFGVEGDWLGAGVGG